MDTSSEEEENDEEEEGNETGGESSSEEDEFDSEDDRVNIIPGEDTEQTPSEAPKASAQDESSSESDEEDDAMKIDLKQPVDDSHLHTQQNVRTFDSDVESEYETDSESEGLDQEPAEDDVVQGTPVDAMEAPPLSQKKVQEAQALESKGTIKEDDVVAKKGKNKTAKLQPQKELPPSRSTKGEVLKNAQEESQSARKGCGGVIKDVVSDDSVRDDKKSGASLKKRKLESSQHEGERDSADSAPILKKRKDVEISQNGKKSAGNDKGSEMPRDIGIDNPSNKKGADRDKLPHTLADVGKEIARKTLNSTAAGANRSKIVLDSKTSAMDHESKQEKRVNSTAISQPASALKQKKLPHVWSVDEEIILASEVLNHVKMGLEVPSKRNHDFWLILSEILQEKLGIEFSREQLSEKARRMKQKYQGTVQKIEESRGSKKPYKHKSDGEQHLFDIMSQIWGRAEVTSLEDQQGANNVAGKDLSKSIQSPHSEVKGMNVRLPKARSLMKANVGKIDAAAIVDDDADAKVNAAAAILTKLDQAQVAKEDQGRAILHTPDISASPLRNVDVDKLLHDRIHATLHELQDWSKRNLEEWMNKAYALIEDSTKRLENQVQCTSLMGMAGGGPPTRFCNAMEIQLVQGDKSYQQKWHELQLQELNVQVQRLELMRKECELKQEQIKVQLQQVQRQK